MELIIISKKHGTHTVYFDDSDHELISKYKWHIEKRPNTYYAATHCEGNKKVRMHTLIMNNPGCVDHIDRCGLNNTRINLRPITKTGNAVNVPPYKNNKTGFKGVSKFRDGFRARINLNGKQIHGGVFDNPISAAKRYNDLAITYFGNEAYLNIINN